MYTRRRGCEVGLKRGRFHLVGLTLAAGLPLRTPEDLLLNPNIFQDFSNGGYF